MQFLRQATPARLFRLCLVGSTLIPLLAGCGGGGGGGSDSGGGGGTPLPTTSVSAIASPSGLKATLSESSSTVAAGGSITYTLTLTNNTGSAVTINATSNAPTQPAAGLIIKDASGNLVYTPLPGFPALDTVTLPSGSSLTSTQSVSAFATRGIYSATATFSDTTPPTSVGPLTVTAQ